MNYGLIGERLGHSFSKEIHEQLGGYSYELVELKREELEDFFKKRDFRAINVTIPYKEAVMPFLDEIDEAALEIGSVNTVVKVGERLIGYNTDIYGISMLFVHAGVAVRGKKAVLLGTGGTYRTSLAYLKKNGAREIISVSRTARDGIIDYRELYRSHTDAEVIINTTPVGMYPASDGCPVEVDKFPRLEGVIDVIYNPLRTELVMNARERGVRAEGGLYMLVAQAVRASELFLGTKYPEGRLETLYNAILSEKENIVLIGMPSSGKSTVGRVLAERLGRELIDTDEHIVATAGKDIPSIFAECGESGFRDVESASVSECAKRSSTVLATGGGAVLREENLRALRRTGRIYFIDRPIEKLIATSDRPLSQTREALETRYSERYPIYTASADAHIDGSGTPAEVAELIIKEFL